MLNKDVADHAMFDLEQYCQLLIRYKLLVKKSSYSRTRSLRRLIRELGELNPEVLVPVNDVGNLHYIARLEEAYISSRYLPVEYEVPGGLRCTQVRPRGVQATCRNRVN